MTRTPRHRPSAPRRCLIAQPTSSGPSSVHRATSTTPIRSASATSPSCGTVKRIGTGWSTSTAVPTFGNFKTWNPGEGYTLLIGEEGGAQSYVVWTIGFYGNGLLVDDHRLPLLAGQPAGYRGFPSLQALDCPKMRRSDRIVTGGFARVATTDEPVPLTILVAILGSLERTVC